MKTKLQRILGIVGLVIIIGLACSDDDDTPTDPGPGVQPAISVEDQAVVEGNTVLFVIDLDQSTTHAVTFTFSTVDGTAVSGSDYLAVTGSDTIAAGETSTTILVPTVDDSDVEAAETFSILLNSVAGASVAKSTATATINDNDFIVLPTIAIADQSVTEGQSVLFDVTLNKTAEQLVTFSFFSSDGTATPGVDYLAVSSTDSISVGQDATTILVPTLDDATLETPEAFTLTITSIIGATPTDSSAVAIIYDNDATGVSFSNEVQPLLRTSCANIACHGGALPGGDMYLGTNANYVDVRDAAGPNTGIWSGSPDSLVVQPGNSNGSTLYRKVDTTGTIPFASRMPLGASPLSREQQLLIRDWIDQGAPDN